MDEVLKKKQYVQVCTLTLENSNQKYSDLAALLNVSIPFEVKHMVDK